MRTKALHQQYAQQIFNYCLRRLRSREEAEDAAQIVFLNAHRCLEEGIEPTSERAWLFKIAEHVVMYRRRTISRRARVEFPIDVDALADLVVAPGRETPAELHGLTDALARIPEAQQRAIVLREWYGLSYREVAAELDISASAAETLIFRARRRLAQELGGPAPTLRRRRPLGLASPLASSLKWLFGGGTTVKALVGATSVAVLAVGSAKVGPLRHPAAPARAAAPARVVALPAAAAPGHVVPLRRVSAVPAAPARKATPRVRRAPAPAVPAPAAAPVAVAAADPVEAVPAPDPDPTPAAEPASTQAAVPPPDDRSQAAVETLPVIVAELFVAADETEPPPAPADVPATEPATEPTTDPPVDVTQEGPGKSNESHGPNENAAGGQAERSEHVPANAADPGNNAHAGGAPQDGDALPQPANPDDPAAPPGNSGDGGPAPQAQGDPAHGAGNGNENGNGNGDGPSGQDPRDRGSAVAV